jgi:flavin prenyltransferase
MAQRIVVGVTGSSAPQLGLTVLQALREVPGLEVHLVVSAGAVRSIEAEMGVSPVVFEELADAVHAPHDMAAPISSGSFKTLGMIVVPCSMRSLAAIATGNASDLVGRAADVCLKERRRLVLLFRETPLHAGHIETMAQATRNGAIVMPPVPAFYHRPSSVDDIVTQTVGRALDLFGIDVGVKRWKDDGAAPS